MERVEDIRLTIVNLLRLNGQMTTTMMKRCLVQYDGEEFILFLMSGNPHFPHRRWDVASHQVDKKERTYKYSPPNIQNY